MTRWEQIDLIQQRLADERGTLVREAPHRIALCYPSPYHVGMSSLGFQTIYRELHTRPHTTAERAFLPDDLDGRPQILSYETQRPLANFPVLAFSVSYELEVPGLLAMLDLSGLPPLASERGAQHPLVVAGGPLTFSNPIPLAPFVDVILLGEAEETIHQLADLVEQDLSRDALLDRLAPMPGFYVPGRTPALGAVARAEDDRLPARSQIVTPRTELSSMFLIEPERGCSRGCTYCVMRRTTNGGMRTVEPERVLSLIPDWARKVGLVGAAVTDHPRVVDLVRALVDGGRQVGISSLRADRLTSDLVGLLAKSGARTLTTAMDGASERLRTALDRKTSEKHLLAAAGFAREHGMERLKLYLMLGIPGETDEDIDELIRFSVELSKIMPLYYGLAPFVAKRNTPMDGAPFTPIAEIEHRIERLRRGVAGRATVRSTSAKWAWVEYMLAQGGEEAGLAALDAWRAGGAFAAWKRAFKERAVKPRATRRIQDGRSRIPALAVWPSVA